jgi:hypothetical protein
VHRRIAAAREQGLETLDGVSKDPQISLFARYWELDTASVGPLQFFGGDGHDFRLITVGLGIAGGREEGFISQLLKKD